MRVLLLCVLTSAAYVCTMDDQSKPMIIQPTKKVDYCELSLNGGMLYIGEGVVRQDLETMFGRKFNLNTIFLPVRFLNTKVIGLKPASAWLGAPQKGLIAQWYNWATGTTGPLPVPEYVAYEDLKNATEDAVVQLTMYGKVYAVLCRQIRNDNRYGTCRFDVLIQEYLQDFSKCSNSLLDGQQSLIDAEVVDTYHCHGKNASPYVIK